LKLFAPLKFIVFPFVLTFSSMRQCLFVGYSQYHVSKLTNNTEKFSVAVQYFVLVTIHMHLLWQAIEARTNLRIGFMELDPLILDNFGNR